MTFTYRRSSFALYGWLLVIVAIMAPMFLLPSSTNEAQAQSSTPAKPTGLTAQPVSHNSVTLAWDDPEDSSITGYQVLRRPLDLDEYGDGLGSAEFVAVVDDTGTSATTYTDTSVAARTRYVYRVKARNAQGLGGASNDADAETAEDPDSQRVQPCQEGYVAPTPTEVPVTAVPIVVESTTADYFVLYASHDVGGTTVEYPVRVVLGEDGTTTLSENVAPLPKDLYRVQKYSIEEPADVDGDCTDDITELGNLGPMNPVNAAPSIDLSDGAVALPDRETFEKLAYPDSGGTWHIKFVILDNDTDRPRVYFQNTRNALHHGPFLDSIGVDWRQEDAVSGIVILDPGLLAQDGSRGVYRFQSRRSYGGTYSFFERAYTLLAANVPFLADNLALWIRSEMLSSIQSDLPLYRSSRMNLVFDEDVYGDIDYMALNPGEGYGMLRSLDPDERPHSRDIVIYETLPNELPRVAGVMSTVPQTPLSHVNLRALQNGIPNAYIADALGDETISGLIDSHVYYAVIDTGYSIRAATQEEVDEHYASSRPAETQTPQRDLTVTSITPLSNIDFDDWDSFGVKAANVAVLRTLGFPEGTVPDGFAVPFYFYDEFMKHNNLYDYIEEMLADTDFQTDYDTKADKLKKLRKKIKKADTPDWIETALTEMHATFPEGTSLRYRSSTNNEDLPNFNGAGLYDSKTQRPEETEEDGISKSLKQVYASLWNFRAFVERDFHRIDHMAAAMGVLVHPNYSDEKVNGVAVSTDPAYGTKGTYYANSQVGEDLVTNPEAHTAPEEVLLNSDGTYSVVALSNKVSQGQLLMTDEQLGQLRQHLAQIHEKFDVLYGIEDGERFAIEIEFKIASDNILAIKQARPWVFTDPPPETGNKPHEVTGDALTAWLVTKPETHDGHPFIVHVRFSDSIDIVASDFRRRAAVVTGGRVTRVWRIDHRRDFWGIQVTPDSHSSNATLALAPNRPCTIGGAICTFDGRRLSNRLEHTVATAVVVARPNIPATGTPSISGTAQVGETLTADTSAIADGNGLDATEFSYQWLADSVDIQGATGNTYILVAADVGKTITVLVSFTDDGGNEERLTSAATAVVAYVDGPPGAPREVNVQAGDTELLVSWQPPAEENKAPVAQYRILYREEGGSNQELHTSHLSQEIGNLTNGVTYSVQVTAKNAAGYGTPSDEVSETPDTLPPWAAKMLVVEYTSVSIGAASADLFSNAWGSAGLQVKSLWSHIPDRDLRLSFEDGVPDAADYTLKVGDLTLEFPAGSSGQSSFRWTDVDVDWEDGQTISVRIVPTSATVTPQPNSPATGAPAISGTAQVGETLTADTSGIADANGLTNVTFNYQWVANDGNTDTDIIDATDPTYELTSADLGRTIKVRVSFTDDAGNSESLTSAGTDEVGEAKLDPCSGGGYYPVPVDVAVAAVPIVVDSTTEEYFVLYVRPGLDSDREIPVSVTLGQNGTTTLTEQLSALPREHYRVEKYLIADPSDVDGDCIDDIGELQDPVGLNPLNPAPAIPSRNGAVAIPDHETFEALSYKGKSVSTDIHLTDLEYVKFYLLGRDTDRPSVYFVNTVRHRAHIDFGNAIELWEAPIWRPRWAMAGAIIYHPNVIAPDGSLGVYRYEFRPLNSYSFDSVAYSYEVLAASMPLLDNNLAYYPMPARASPLYREEKALYDDSRINVLFEEDILPDVDFIPLNLGEGYGFLRVMSLEERPNPRDIVIYETLPNELSRVAGIITTVPQTPLSHVNLRAVQDGVPNAFIRDALDDADIEDLVGGYVHYTVEESGYSIRAATRAEVDAHYAASSPSQAHSPERDLTVTQITALSDIEFEDWTAFGVKAANVAVLGALYFPEGTIPDGFAVPFYFYDEFMKHNEFYDDIEKMLADSDFQSDFDTQESELKKLRKRIKKGETPEWINTALTEMHAEFPAGTSLRYRSSTNNEDLPGFSGAGLYDSKTQHPEETEEDGISKSLKQVYASLWNFRAFTEREFHRIDHLAMAMGVLVHPNYSDELANGVAVSFDLVSGGDESYYVNTQVGEDLVTNPDAYSVPEEILLHQGGDYTVLATSNQVQRGQLLMSDAQMDQLRRHLEVIHDEFEVLYGVEADEPFAMEIEFKITSDDILSIKQARPWVFEAAPSENNPATGAPSIRGTAQVDQTLTADTSGIADADGLVNVSFSYQWIRNDGTTETDIENATSSTYTLSDTDVGETIKVRVSLTDDRGYEETLTSAATTAITGPNTPATGSPTISGTAQVDETLTADVSGVTDADGLDNVSYTYQWVANDGTTDTDIENATAATYTPVIDDQGKTIKVRVSFTDDANNSETLSSEATATVATASQWRADMSVVDYGTGAIGAASADLFSNVGGNAGLQAKWLWYYSPERKLRLAFTERVPGTEELTLQVGDVALALQPGDATYSWEDVDIDWEDGQTLTARIVRARANAVVAPNSPATGAPTINGTAQVGETLTADTSGIVDADGLTNVSYSYQWIRNDGTTDTDIQGAISSTYTLVSADEGKTIKVRVSFTDDAGYSETLTSGTTNAVAARANSPATGLATISGTAQVGEVLTADTPGIVDADGLTSVSYSYQWIRNDGNTDADIGGQTASTYTLVTTDQGKTIKVKVSFTDDQGNEETLTSAATAEVAAKPDSAPTGLPTINGTAQVGETLSADTSAIADEDGLTNVSYSYQWIRNDGETDTDVEGATDATYQLSGGEVGETMKVRVSFTDDADHEETLTSAATGVVAAKPNSPATGAPTIDGTARVGETLTADTSGIADSDGLDNATFSYRWIRDDGGMATDIAGETDSTYTLVSADTGKTVKVRVSFTDDADNQESLTSAYTDTVAATKPGVPGRLNVFPHDAGALDVYWEAPASDGGSAITGYKVQWKESADSWDTPADVSEETASGTVHTITGLTDGVEYTVRVLATNGVGDSPPSVEQTGTPRETKAPEMVRPRVDGATLKVLYDEALDEGSAPPADSFDVRVACTCDDTTWLDEEAKREVESVSVDGDTVVLTLVSAATSEDVVVVSYTPPSDAATARTRDLAGNAAAGFNATEVFNDTDETAESEKSGEPEETTEGETPLTVGLEAATESHNGTDAFTFEIRFSEEVKLSYVTLRDHAFSVTDGTVTRAKRMTQGSNIGWTITVTPDSAADVTVVLPVTTDCDADGAVCTGDGRKLSNRLELTVSGPDV